MLKNRVALAHKRPRVHFLDTSEKHLTRISLLELQAEQTTLTLLKSLLKLKRSALLSDPL